MQGLIVRNVIGLAKQINGLYFLQASNAVVSFMNNVVSQDTWHKRLDHLSSVRLQQIVQNCIPDSKSVFCSSYACHSCPLAKQTKLLFLKSSISTSNVIELVHCDVWGKFSVPSFSDFHYFLTIVDDYSRCTWVYLLRNKTEASGLLKSFFSVVSTQFNAQIKCLRSNNGTKFLSSDFISFLAQKGLTHQLSCLYTPHQNGVVERKHRHLLEVARALRVHANLPLKC